jgi:predicted transcriptional regulator
MKRFLSLLLLALPLLALESGGKLPELTLSGNEGGKADGTPWSSESLQGKVYVIFYVDPDKKDLNEPFVEILKRQKFDRRYYGSVAIVNMEATWMPNFAIEAALKNKQEKYPDTIYVKDKVKKGVEVWRMADDDANLLIVDAAGRVAYVCDGKIPKESYPKIIEIIRQKMAVISY